MSSLRNLVLAALAALPLAACSASAPSQAVTMADSFDLDLFGPHVDDLHTPYVAGASFTITATATSGGAEATWTLASSDPDVVTVVSQLGGGSASVVARGPGQATLSVIDASGRVLDSHPVTVAVPDQVALYAEGLLLTGASDATAQVTHASVVSGGTATFLVRYFAQGVELYGSGALDASATTGFVAETASESFATARDFVEVTAPDGAATGTVSLEVAGIEVSEVAVTAVAPAAVTHVTILPQSTGVPEVGSSYVLYAHAVDAASADVYGASFAWAIDGQAQGGGAVASASGPADLFFYTFDGSASETVSASYDGFTPSTVVHAQGGSVGSTADVGCSVSGAPGAGGGAWGAGLGLALAGVGLSRRRRG